MSNYTVMLAQLCATGLVWSCVENRRPSTQ